MILNYNSFNAKLYRYFYNEKDMPDSICPYFWKLLMAGFFIIPVSLFSFPVIIIEIISKESYGLIRIFFSFLIYLLLFIISSMFCSFLLFFNQYNEDSLILQLGKYGLVFWLLLIVLSVRKIVKYIIFRSNNKLEDSVIIEFVKSIYNKYCVKITWKKWNKKYK